MCDLAICLKEKRIENLLNRIVTEHEYFEEKQCNKCQSKQILIPVTYE